MKLKSLTIGVLSTIHVGIVPPSWDFQAMPSGSTVAGRLNRLVLSHPPSAGCGFQGETAHLHHTISRNPDPSTEFLTVPLPSTTTHATSGPSEPPKGLHSLHLAQLTRSSPATVGVAPGDRPTVGTHQRAEGAGAGAELMDLS